MDIEHHPDKYNSCNALVLPSKKRKTKNITGKESTTKLLSKKHRKQLEKVIERKQKKLKVNFIIYFIYLHIFYNMKYFM